MTAAKLEAALQSLTDRVRDGGWLIRTKAVSSPGSRWSRVEVMLPAQAATGLLHVLESMPPFIAPKPSTACATLAECDAELTAVATEYGALVDWFDRQVSKLKAREQAISEKYKAVFKDVWMTPKTLIVLTSHMNVGALERFRTEWAEKGSPVACDLCKDTGVVFAEDYDGSHGDLPCWKCSKVDQLVREDEKSTSDDVLAELATPPSPRCDTCGVSGVVPGPNGGHTPCLSCDRGRKKASPGFADGTVLSPPAQALLDESNAELRRRVASFMGFRAVEVMPPVNLKHITAETKEDKQ